MRILEVRTVQANVIKILCEALKELIPDINLVFSKLNKDSDNSDGSNFGGICAITMAMSNNVLLHLKLDGNNFDYFECKRDKFVAGVNTALLFKVMKTMNNNDTITFFVDEEDENKLGIKFENKYEMGSGFELPMVSLKDKILTPILCKRSIQSPIISIFQGSP